ncbi:MAG: hypothetical protein ABSD03_04245 [Vulcanimicrobiaceae bacterium]
MIVTHPLTIAEIFDRATTLVVRRWVPTVSIAAVLALPRLLQAIVFPNAAASSSAWFFAVLLTVVSLFVMPVFASAALALIFVGPDGTTLGEVLSRLFAAPWRFVRAALLYGFLGVVGILPLLGLISTMRGGTSTTVLVVVLLFFVWLVPALVGAFELQLAFVGCAIEETGATLSLMNACERSLRPGLRWRTVLLAFALTAAQTVPSFVLGWLIGVIAFTLGTPWVASLGVAVVEPLVWVVVIALTTVAAVDYRVRVEGSDLEAVLDATAPA